MEKRVRPSSESHPCTSSTETHQRRSKRDLLTLLEETLEVVRFASVQECNQLFVSVVECLERNASRAKDNAAAVVTRDTQQLEPSGQGKCRCMPFSVCGNGSTPCECCGHAVVDPGSEEQDVYCAECLCSLGVRGSNELGELPSLFEPDKGM
jgi:hypothetical protein